MKTPFEWAIVISGVAVAKFLSDHQIIGFSGCFMLGGVTFASAYIVGKAMAGRGGR